MSGSGIARAVPAWLAAAFLAATVVAVLPATAGAYFAPGAQIVSVSPEKREQADDSTSAVDISDDGRYVVFQTRARNLFEDSDPDPPGQFRVGGIFRRDLQTGALELVAPGELRDESAPDDLLVRGALNPSVSADGRYVAFSTGWQLSAADTNTHIDVYVRDMSQPAGSAGAYRLVSALDGADTAAAWGAPATDRPGRNQGAELSPGSAISSDGSRVIFRTQEASNLPGGGAPTVAAQQVFVRDLNSRTTTLLTRDRNTAAPAGGGLAAAVISGDGNAVLWVGREAQAQTLFLAGEGPNPVYEYYLYRRLDQGPSAPTRRITGIADLDDPSCSPSSAIVDNPVATGPCYGPLAQVEAYVGGIVSQVPAISHDGWRIAFLTNATPRAQPQTGFGGDLYVTDMSPGVSRKAGTVELTREALGSIGANEPLEGVAISADGRWVALTTFRRTFSLPALRATGPARGDGGARELYLVDLASRTIERVLRSRGGGDSDGSVGVLPAVDGSGRRVAFLSAASNLFFGDANGRFDAFTADRLDAPPPEPEPPALPEPPVSVEDASDEPPVQVRSIVAGARKAKAGRVRVRIVAPVAGSLEISVRGRLPGAGGRPTGTARVLAGAERELKRRGTVTVEMKLKSAFRSRLRSAGRITAQATVELTSPDGDLYRRAVTVQFRR